MALIDWILLALIAGAAVLAFRLASGRRKNGCCSGGCGGCSGCSGGSCPGCSRHTDRKP